MSNNRITVWTPVFNGEKTLARCIESIVGQSIKPFEYLILDDCSTDGSLDIAFKYAQDFPWIKVIKNDANRGAFANFNRILYLAKGDYLYAVADDDFSYPQTIEKFTEAFLKWPNAAVIFGDESIVNEFGVTIAKETLPYLNQTTYIEPKDFSECYLKKVPCNHSLAPASLIKKALLDELNGYNDKLGFWADSFITRFGALKYGSVYIPNVVHAFSINSNSMSNNVGDNIEIIRFLESTTDLMKSCDFANYFPSEYVNSWEIDYRKLISKSFSDKFDILQIQKNLHLSKILGCKEISYFTRIKLSFFMKIEHFIMNYFVKIISRKFITHTFR
jgi:glycosyltransferase involved in cell wall biosynthesis